MSFFFQQIKKPGSLSSGRGRMKMSKIIPTKIVPIIGLLIHLRCCGKHLLSLIFTTALCFLNEKTDVQKTSTQLAQAHWAYKVPRTNQGLACLCPEGGPARGRMEKEEDTSQPLLILSHRDGHTSLPGLRAPIHGPLPQPHQATDPGGHSCVSDSLILHHSLT